MEYILNFSKCCLSFNGRNLDRIIDGYSTINVEGRQMFSPSLSYQRVRGRDGDILIEDSYPSREIKVHYLIKAENNQWFLKKMKLLTMYLQSKEDVEFSFADEQGVRFGRLSSFDDPPFDSNVGIGKFTIHCSDPYLYSKIRSDTNQIRDLVYDYYPIRPESIEMTLTSSANKLVLKNITRGLRIVLNTDFKAGDKVTFKDWKVYKNKENILSMLDYVESDYFDFDIYARDKISCNLANNVIINFRERVL
jgi:predicted phage tail component-like protein